MFSNKNLYPFFIWIIVGFVVVLLSYLLIKSYPYYSPFIEIIWRVLLPFIVACFIAYLLFPVVKKIHSYKIPKSIAVLVIYLVFFGGSAYLSYRLYPMTMHQLRDLNEQLPQLLKMYETLINQLYESTSYLPETVHDKMDDVISSVESKLDGMIGKSIGNITKLFDMIVFITVLPVLVFYFLKDHEKIKTYFISYIPVRRQSIIKNIVLGIDESLGNYIRGQLLVCLFVAVATYAIFELLNMDYSLLLAMIMGLTNIIPYFGPIIGAVPAVAIALTMSGEMVLFVITSVFVIQLIESNLIAPYIVGKSINIHPIAIIVVLLFGGEIAGIAGMILAVPILTISREIIKRLVLLRQED